MPNEPIKAKTKIKTKIKNKSTNTVKYFLKENKIYRVNKFLQIQPLFAGVKSFTITRVNDKILSIEIKLTQTYNFYFANRNLVYF